MLSISARGNATTAAAYYQHLATGREEGIEDYYAREGAGVWMGSGADALGLKGNVAEGEFVTLARGYHPDGSALTQNAGQETHRAGWDLTLSAPKSVSVAWGLGDEETRRAIEHAHDAAAASALNYIEHHAAISRRGRGGETLEAAGLVVSAFRHGTSREQDPQLHSHLFVHNVSVRKDGTTGTLQSRYFYQWQKAAGAAYRVELAQHLQELGYEIERDRDSFRLKQIPRAAEKEFSQRRQQIEAALQERATHGARASEAATLATRRAKEITSAEDLRERWQERGREYRIEARPRPEKAAEHHRENCASETILSPSREAEPQNELRAREIETALVDRSAIRAAATEKNATFTEAQAAARVLVELQGKADLSRAEQEVGSFLHHDSEIVRLEAANEGPHSNQRYTTREMLAVEQRIVHHGAALADRHAHAVSEPALADALAARPTLSPEQRQAVTELARGSDLALMQGHAGTGKSFSLGAAGDAWRGAGYEVVGLAPSGQAASELEQGSGIASTTVSAFLGERFTEHADGTLERNASAEQEASEGRTSAQALSARHIIVIDEAGTLGTRKLARVLDAVEEAGAKAVLVGDTQQLQAVEAGAPFRVLQERHGYVELTDNRRQQAASDREAVAAFRAGDAEAALDNLAARGHVHETRSARDAKAEMAAAIASDLAEGKSSFGVCATRQDARDVNVLARTAAQEHGLVGNENVRVLTRAGTREFSVGDRVQLRRNVNGGERAQDIGGPVKNGWLGTVKTIEAHGERDGNAYARIRVVLDHDRGERILDTRAYDHLELGYASTAHSKQGATVDRAHVLANETAMPTGREWAYVSTTRHREAVHLYADKASLETLAPDWSKARQKDAALDYQRAPTLEVERA